MIFRESRCEKFIDFINKFEIEIKPLQFSQKLSIEQFEQTSEELRGDQNQIEVQYQEDCQRDKIISSYKKLQLVKQQDLFVIMLKKERGMTRYHQNFMFHLSLNYKRLFNQKSVFDVDFDFEANKHIFTKKLDQVLRQIHKVDQSHEPKQYLKSNASRSHQHCGNTHKHIQISKYIVTKPEFKKIINIYDLNVQKCTSSNARAKRKYKVFLQEELFEKQREQCSIHMILNKIDSCIKNMGLRTLNINQKQSRFLIQEMEWFNLSDYKQLRRFRQNAKFLYEFSALEKILMKREYYQQLVHKNREEVCNYIKLTKPHQLENISQTVSLFDIKTKISRNYFIYSEIDWGQLNIQTEKFHNNIRQIHMMSKKISQGKQQQIDMIISKDYLNKDSQLHIDLSKLEPPNFRVLFNQVPKVVKVQLTEQLLEKKVYNMLYNHKVGVVHQDIKDLFNFRIVPKNFDSISRLYHDNSQFFKRKDVNVFADRYLQLLTEFSENKASIYFKANYSDIAKLLVSQNNHNDLYSQMHDHQLDYQMVIRIKHLKNNLTRMFLPKLMLEKKDKQIKLLKDTTFKKLIPEFMKISPFVELDTKNASRRALSSRAEERGNLRQSCEIIEQANKLQTRSNSYVDGHYNSKHFILEYKRQNALDRYAMPYKLNYISRFVKKNKFIMESKVEDQAFEKLIDKNDKDYSNLTWNFGFQTEYRRDVQQTDQIYSVYRQKIQKERELHTINIYDKLTLSNTKKQIKIFYKKFKKRTQQKIMDAIKVDEIQTDEDMQDLYLEDFNFDYHEKVDTKRDSQSNPNSNRNGVKTLQESKQLLISHLTKQDGTLEHYQKLKKLREQKGRASIKLGQICADQHDKVFKVEQISAIEQEHRFAAQRENRMKVEKLVKSTVDAVYLDNREHLHQLYNDIEYYKRRMKKRKKLQRSPGYKQFKEIHLKTAEMDKQEIEQYQQAHDNVKKNMMQNYAQSNLQEFKVLQDAHIDTSNDESPVDSYDGELNGYQVEEDKLLSNRFQKEALQNLIGNRVSKLLRQNCKTSENFEGDPLLLGNEIELLQMHEEQHISKWDRLLMMRDIRNKARQAIDKNYKDAYQKIREKNEKDKAQMKYSEIIRRIYQGLNVECQIFTPEALEQMRTNKNLWKQLIAQKRKKIKITKKDNRNLVFKADEHQKDHRVSTFDISKIRTKLFNAVKQKNSQAVKTTLQRYVLSHEDVTDSSGNTLIIMAAINNDFEMIHLLLKMGLSPNGQNQDGNSALHFAINGNYRKCIDTLIQFGADESVKNNLGQMPWEQAFVP